MNSWFAYLKQGLSQQLPRDRISSREGYSGLKAGLKNVWPFFLRHWRKGVLAACLIVVTTLLSFPQPLIMRYLVDDVILSHELVLMAGAIFLLVGIFAAERLSTLLQQFYCTRFEQEVIVDIQHGLFDRVLRFPKSFFDKNQTGYLMSRISSDVQGLRWFFSGTVIHIVTNVVRFAGGLGLLLYLEWRLGLGVLVLLPGMVLAVRYLSGRIHALSHQRMEQQANVSTQIQESLYGASLIKAFSSEDRAAGRLRSQLRAIFQISMEQSAVNSVANTVISFMPGIARAVTLALGAYWIIGGQWTLGSLLAFQVYLGYVFGPAQFLATANLQLQQARAALERVSALFDIVPEENLDRGKSVEKLSGDIEFKNVCFSYNGCGESVLKNISFHIRPGEHVAIVGSSGVGKTTLLSLILRFYKPGLGEVYFDGRPASDYRLSSLRQRIGYVSQSTLLLRGSIMENLCYGNPGASSQEITRAARAAGIHEFIASLPQGYDAEVGEKGVNLSEGQKQRLSIARALVKDPDILVLDEPSSALDSLTERSIFQSLPKLLRDKTLFIVAHRLSIIKESDRILVLDDSGLVATGTHSLLMKTSTYYRSLLAHQEMGD
jgi:ABC-type multidrug transport system fused ATPase/permease subunit